MRPYFAVDRCNCDSAERFHGLRLTWTPATHLVRSAVRRQQSMTPTKVDFPSGIHSPAEGYEIC